jgi:hypothetical protein
MFVTFLTKFVFSLLFPCSGAVFYTIFKKKKDPRQKPQVLDLFPKI